MQTVLAAVVALIWLGGALLRIYRQARFYQIEEYMSRRYLRWLLQERERWLPYRPLTAWFVGTAAAVLLGEAPGSPLPGVIAAVAALVAVWPPGEGEVKKRFVRTQRALRLLGAAFVLAAGLLGLLLLIISGLPLPEMRSIQFAIIGLTGLLLFLDAPLLLVAGSAVMTPVEALLRQRYLQQARAVMAAVRPKVIGITGSYGKTTTKSFLTTILSGRYRVYATPRSYNTLMGISRAINQDVADDYSIEYFISEMGAYIPGEIARICELTPPDISIVIEVGPQHLERFGSLENVAVAKYEIIRALPPDGLGIFNWDNPYVREMYERGHPQRRIAVSTQADAPPSGAGGPRFVAADVQESLNGLSFRVVDRESGQEEVFSTGVLGRHNVLNILLATAAAVHEGMSLREVALRVQALRPAESRLVQQHSPAGVTIINDAYSANPVGTLSALQVLGLHRGGRRLLITPGMVELGELHEVENRRLGEAAAQHATDIILVGSKRTEPIREGALAAGFPAERLRVVETLAEARDWYEKHLTRGDTVLFLNDLPDTY